MAAVIKTLPGCRYRGPPRFHFVNSSRRHRSDRSHRAKVSGLSSRYSAYLMLSPKYTITLPPIIRNFEIDPVQRTDLQLGLV